MVLAVVGAIAVSDTVLARSTATDRVSGDLNKQRGVSRSGRILATSSTRWRDVRGLSLVMDCMWHAASATVSVGLSGRGPVGIRVFVTDLGHRETFLMEPGEIRFDPRSGNPSFSYTFVHGFRSVRTHYLFQVQWRSPSGKRVTLRRGSLNVLEDVIETGGC